MIRLPKTLTLVSSPTDRPGVEQSKRQKATLLLTVIFLAPCKKQFPWMVCGKVKYVFQERQRGWARRGCRKCLLALDVPINEDSCGRSSQEDVSVHGEDHGAHVDWGK
jgi:hypothetical protein